NINCSSDIRFFAARVMSDAWGKFQDGGVELRQRVGGGGQNWRIEGRGKERSGVRQLGFKRKKEWASDRRFLTSTLFPQILPSALAPQKKRPGSEEYLGPGVSCVRLARAPTGVGALRR